MAAHEPGRPRVAYPAPTLLRLGRRSGGFLGPITPFTAAEPSVVVRTFLSLGLLDEVTISVVPSLIGAGLPLFGGVKLESGVKLEQATSYSNGVVQMRYLVRGP